ncbi:MAG: GTP-binding protein [Candidatus Heimdallarchaeota archaeon]|nr:GTP-binding protein [Candidatus Heimdallarchaeota archaeon]MDH5645252.1 GTP-binding protein [Candidatus Heimdallarchaeota archaeon]
MSEGKEFLFKILLLGDGAVGKTSIRERYMGKGFSGSYAKTIGADFASKDHPKGGHKIKLQIFDLAGQDAYVVARKAFYKGGQAAFLVFDLQDSSTMSNLRTWIKDGIDNSAGTINTFVILGNKADLTDTRQVSNEMAIEFCQQVAFETGITFVFLETSAKTGLNIDVAFDIMTTRLLKKFNIDIPLDLPDGVSLIGPGGATSSSTSAEDKQAIQAVAQAAKDSNKATMELQGKLELVVKKIEEMDKRLGAVEERFTKLASIVKQLVDSNNNS